MTKLDYSKLHDLEGRTAFITGAAGHLGSAMTQALVQNGCDVILNGRNQNRLSALKEKLEDLGGSVETVCFDIQDTDELTSALSRVGRLDILINNAYTGTPGSLESATDTDFQTAFESGVTAAFNATRAALPALKASVEAAGHASVINIASMYGHISPDPGLYGESGLNSPPYYGPAKAGLIQLTKYLACQLAPEKIRVNAISPGPFPTYAIQDERPDFVGRLAAKTPMGRIGAPQEIAGPVLFLASDASTYVTGTNLCVDGGWTVW